MRRIGYRTDYLPGITILHYENATSDMLFNLSAQVNRNHAIFQSRHAAWLQEQPQQPHWNAYRNRRADDTAVNVLLFPTHDHPENIGQLTRILERLDAMPTVLLPRDATVAATIHEQLPNTVEFIPIETAEELEDLLAERPGYFDLALAPESLPEAFQTVLSNRSLRLACLQQGQFRFVA
jgi:hypothetical protein